MVDPRIPTDPHSPAPVHDDLSPRAEGFRELDDAGRRTGWGWIIGGVVALFLVFAFVFGFSGTEQTASNDTAPATTGQTTRPPMAQAPGTAQPPAQENTGAAPREAAPQQ